MSGLSTPNVFSPLSIIFTFFSFTEVMAGYAVFKTTGVVQMTLTVFVVAFPTLAATAFFLLLWHKPKNFYRPGDFYSDEGFLKSHEESQEIPQFAQFQAEIQRLINFKLTSAELVDQVASSDNATQVKNILGSAASDIAETIRNEQFFTVTFAPFATDLEDLTLPADGYQTVNDLMTQLHRVLRDRVRPYYYGTDWALRNAATGQTIKTARMLAGLPPGKRLPDTRSLPEVGIRAGTCLEVFKPT